MATTPRTKVGRDRDAHLVDGVDYPTSDGKPMGETDLHREEMFDVIKALQRHFAADPQVYVTGNILLFYEPGDKRRHISPDAFVALGVPKSPPRDYYLVWKEPKGPDVVIEITSRTTRREDQKKKLALYRDVLKVPEYFQSDPTEDYLKPPLQGFRLVDGEYRPIEFVNGRLPSLLLGLDLVRDGTRLRFIDQATGHWLLTPTERVDEEARRANEATERVNEIALENDRLRREVEALRRRSGSPED